MIELHWDTRWQVVLVMIRRLVLTSGPCDAMRRTTCDTVDRFSSQYHNFSWFFRSIQRAIADLPLVIVTPCVHAPIRGAYHTVQRTRRNSDYLLAPQSFDHSRDSNMVIRGVTKTEIITFAPEKTTLISVIGKIY